MSCVLDLLRRLPARLRANDPDPDSYETKVRVLALICLMIFGFAPFIAGVIMSIDRPPEPLSVGYFIVQTGMVVFPATWWPVLAWALVIGKTVPIMMDLVIGGSFAASFLITIGSPAFDTAYCTMLVFVASSLTIGTVWWKAWYVVAHVLAAMQAYNRISQHAGWQVAGIDPWKLEDINTLSFSISTLGFGCGAVFLCATLLLQRFEYLRAQAAAVAAADVTATIAAKLQVYDTTAAAEALQHEAAASVDKKLMTSFTALVANLESYRPHLPNWLLASTDDDEEADDDGKVLSLEHSRSVDSHGLAKMQLGSVNSTPPGRPMIGGVPTSISDLQQGEDISASSFSSGDLRSDPSSTHTGSAGHRYRRGSKSRHAARVSPSPEMKGPIDVARTNALEKRSYLKGTVTFAIVEYVTEDVPDLSLSETLTAVADAVHRCAAECKGAVHTMLLGEIVVSWNVATRVAGPEAKAAKFLLSLRTALAADENVHHGFKAVAAAASHHARSETIGTSKKLLTSERTGSLRFKLRGILRFAWASQLSAQRRPQRRDSASTSSPLSILLLDERITREASSNFIISAGAVLDLSNRLPVVGMLDSSQPQPPEQATASDPATVSPPRCISPRSMDAARRVSAFARSSEASPVLVSPAATLQNSAAKQLPSLPGQPSSVPTPSSQRPVSLTLVPAQDETRHQTVSVDGLAHVFDLVCPRTGGDDEWLYAMEEGAADAARAAQLMVGAGLRRQSGGVDAAAVRAAFEEAGKQRDGAAIMARPLVRQMIEGLDFLPVYV